MPYEYEHPETGLRVRCQLEKVKQQYSAVNQNGVAREITTMERLATDCDQTVIRVDNGDDQAREILVITRVGLIKMIRVE